MSFSNVLRNHILIASDYVAIFFLISNVLIDKKPCVITLKAEEFCLKWNLPAGHSSDSHFNCIKNKLGHDTDDYSFSSAFASLQLDKQCFVAVILVPDPKLSGVASSFLVSLLTVHWTNI